DEKNIGSDDNNSNSIPLISDDHNTAAANRKSIMTDKLALSEVTSKWISETKQSVVKSADTGVPSSSDSSKFENSLQFQPDVDTQNAQQYCLCPSFTHGPYL